MHCATLSDSIVTVRIRARRKDVSDGTDPYSSVSILIRVSGDNCPVARRVIGWQLDFGAIGILRPSGPLALEEPGIAG